MLIEDAVTFAERKRTATRVPLILQDELGIALGIFAKFDFGGGWPWSQAASARAAIDRLSNRQTRANDPDMQSPIRNRILNSPAIVAIKQRWQSIHENRCSRGIGIPFFRLPSAP